MNKLKSLIQRKEIVVAPGVFSPFVARLAEKTGFHAVYFSGAAFSNNLALPDLGVITMTEVYNEVSRITDAVSIPVIVDLDTGYGEAVNVQRAALHMIRAGASAIQIEDQVLPKKCGHLPKKEVVEVEEMVKKIIAAKDSSSGRLMVVARTDARSVEGMDSALDRARAYSRAGADVIFPEALQSVDEFIEFRKKISKPLLANMTEFGVTPYISVEEFRKIGYNIVIFPVTTFRAAMKAAERALQTIKKYGTQKGMLEAIMTRDEVYKVINYYEYESADSSIMKRARALLKRDNSGRN